MKQDKALEFSFDTIGFPIFLVLLMWVVYWIEIKFNLNLNHFGIYPLKVSGLIGVVTGPFLHGSLKHLFNNSIPLLVLLVSLFYFYKPYRWRILIWGFLLTGILTWFIGRPSLHIGASGIVYMLVSFLFFKGMFSRQYQLTALALVVIFLYGGLWWYLFPIDPGISWEGHLSGFLVGFIFVFIFKTVPLLKREYEWEKADYDPSKDKFLQQFDEEGNFIGYAELQKRKEEQEYFRNLEEENGISVNYTLTDKKSDDQ